MLGIKAERLRVLYPDGRFAYSVDSNRARQMTHSGVAIGIGNKRKIHTLQLVEGPSRPIAGTKYSHNRENRRDDAYGGVQNVWTLRRLDDGTSRGERFAQTIFHAVPLSCLV